MKKRAASRPRTRQPEPTELAPLVGVLLRVRFPAKEVLGPFSPEGSEYPPDSMERRAWANLEGIVLSSLANVEGPETLLKSNSDLHIFADFQYVGVPGGVFLDNEEGWLRHELKEKLPEFVRNPAAGEATLIEYDRPEVGRCRVRVRIVNSSNDRTLTIESGTATSSEMAPETDPEPARRQALDQLRNVLDSVKTQARGDADLRRESAELLEGALGELRMPAVEDWAPAHKAEQHPPSQEPPAPEPKPTKEQSLLREGDPLIEAFAKFWDERGALSRDQCVVGFQTLLNQFHERQTLGTFELNRAATQWVNFISKKLKILMFNEKESIRVRCSSGIPEGYFVLCRTSGKGTPLPGTGSKTFPRLTTLSLSGSHTG